MANEREKAIATWLLRLKGQTREGKERITAKGLGDMARMLAVDFPPEAFCQESLHAVSAAAPDGWFPGAYAVMNRLLGHWWAANKPASADANWPPGINGLARAPAIGSWFRRYHTERPAAEAIDDARIRRLGAFTDPPYETVYAPRTDRANSAVARLASMVRRYSPAAWGLISGGDGATREPPAPLHAVQQAVATVAAHRDRAGMFDPPASHAIDQQREAAFGDIPPLVPRGPGDRRPLTAEQLAAARAGAVGP